ncbi:glycoside hydrolase family 5 protein [Aeromicrobium stalagmiti]|uniref:glycoside hydrolase family 5 protein n=1 Tax=Aeromicrobium stalagmiti TaxID=2738988 RepID=UPI001567F525|nr:cellulase family glycosylhydrolase [Aeromicrobium stalagmiti]NRQ48282.1 cellulase family glycosylhydrolase [Aeromicrobium stalagmiti]
MGRLPRIVIMVLLVAAVAGGVAWKVTDPGDAAVPAKADMGGPVEPRVDGNRLVDARTGDTWVPHGVNWSSFEYACTQGWGYSSITSAADADQIAAAIASWSVDTVRLPLNQDCWLGTRGAPVSDAETERTAEGYRAEVARFVDALHAQRIVVILDLQSRKRETEDEFGNIAMPDAGSIEFWRSIAAEYADDRSVMFDAFNEPYSRYDEVTASYAFELDWTCWRDGGCAAPVEDDKSELTGRTYPVQGMAAVVSAIRGEDAEQPIMLAGLDYANDLSQWLDHRPDDDQLVASFHNYNFQRCKDEACWAAEIAPVADEVPLLTGEIGQDDPGLPHLADYMAWADERGIGYLAWVWWDHADDPMALITGPAGEPTTPYGSTFRSHLLGLSGR